MADSSSEKTIQRFEIETKITAKLHHPILWIFMLLESGMPSLYRNGKDQGTNLKDLIKSQGALPEVLATAVGICICRALIYAHKHDINFLEKCAECDSL
jgi:serine/threonine protein kinase